MATAISFPALSFCKDSIVPYVDDDTFFFCNYGGLRQIQDLEYYVVDSEGCSFVVSNPEPVEKGNFLSWLFTKITYRLFRIRRSICQTDRLSLQEFKDKVCATLDCEALFWESSRPLPEWKDLVRKSKSHRELIELFC